MLTWFAARRRSEPAPRKGEWRHVYLYGPARKGKPYRVYSVELVRPLAETPRRGRAFDARRQFIPPEYETLPLTGVGLAVHIPWVCALRSDAEALIHEHWTAVRKIPLTALPEPIPNLLAWYSAFLGWHF